MAVLLILLAAVLGSQYAVMATPTPASALGMALAFVSWRRVLVMGALRQWRGSLCYPGKRNIGSGDEENGL